MYIHVSILTGCCISQCVLINYCSTSNRSLMEMCHFRILVKTRSSTFSFSLILKVPNSCSGIKMKLTVVIIRDCNARYTWSILCEWLLKESIDFHLFCLLLTHNSGHSHDPFKMDWRRAVRKWTEPKKWYFVVV